TLPTLPAQPKAHAVGCAPRNARLDRLGHVSQAAVGINLRHLEVQVDLGSGVRVLQAQVDRGLEVLARNLHRRALRARAARAAAQALEDVAEVEVLERERSGAIAAAVAELPLPVGWRPEALAGRVASQLVVGLALLGILQRLVRLGDLLEFLLALRILGDVG